MEAELILPTTTLACPVPLEAELILITVLFGNHDLRRIFNQTSLYTSLHLIVIVLCSQTTLEATYFTWVLF